MPYFCDPKNNGYGYAPRDRLQTTINEYFEKSAQSYLAGAKECAAQNSDDKSVIDSINTAYDVHAISQAIGGDKLIRYWGMCVEMSNMSGKVIDNYRLFLWNTAGQCYCKNLPQLDRSYDP